MSFDATGQQIISSGTLTNAYDGDRLRGKKMEGTVATFYLRSSVLGGQVVAELSDTGAWKRGFVYIGGQMVGDPAEQCDGHCCTNDSLGLPGSGDQEPTANKLFGRNSQYG